jgi:DNA repair photolyase
VARSIGPPPVTSALPGSATKPGRGAMRSAEGVDPERRRGRGAASNRSGRFERERRESVDDGWGGSEELAPFKTEITLEKPRSLITRNASPDISFDRSINPYRGCEHGCVYCYARPTHAYMGLSPGLDFESKLFVKAGAAALLERELAAQGYKPKTIAIGTNTDPYQPIERQQRVMRAILEVLARSNHPVGIVTKSALVTRDIDLLAPLAAKGLAKVALSITTLDGALARSMEPRACTPARRLAAVRQLSQAGIPVCVMVAPIIPAVNEAEIERILEAAREAGASEAGYVLLRLPLEVRDLMRDWLMEHHPAKLRHVLVADPVVSGRQGLRGELGPEDDGVRALCLDGRPALRGRGGPAGLRQAAQPSAHGPVPTARWPLASSCPCSENGALIMAVPPRL